MRKITWIPLVILVVGICLVAAGWALGGHKIANVGFYWQNGLHFSGVGNNGTVGELVKIDETYKANDVHALDIDVAYLDRIVVVQGEAGSDIRVRGANYEEYGGLITNMTGSTLSVGTRDFNDDRHYIFRFNIFSDTENCYLEITVPRDIKLTSMTAMIDASRIKIQDIDCGTLVLDNDYGDIELAGIKSDDLKVLANAGQLKASNITVARVFEIDSDFGNVKLNDINAEDIKIEANAGSIELNTVSAKRDLDIDNDFGDVNGSNVRAADMNIDLNSGQMIFKQTATNTATLKNDYGNISFERFTLSGLCSVESSAGKVYFGLTNNEDEVGYNLEAEVGTISLGGGRSETENGTVSQNLPNHAAHISIENSFGDVTLEFGK